MRDLGFKAEDRATDYLRDNGYKIIYRNERFYGVEVDIVAVKDQVLNLIEVKYRGGMDLAINALQPEQIKRIKRVVNFFSDYKEFSIKLIAVTDRDLVMLKVV